MGFRRGYDSIFCGFFAAAIFGVWIAGWIAAGLNDGNPELPLSNAALSGVRFSEETSTDRQPVETEPVEFSYLSTYSDDRGAAVNAKWNCYYADSFFEGSAYQYRQDLALASLCLSMAAFNSAAGGTEAYCMKGENVEALLRDLGFEKIALYGYDQEPGINSVGAAFAQKEIRTKGKAYTLIAAAVRGNGYGKEWIGNFHVGAGRTHKGFRSAAGRLGARLNTYLKEYRDVLQPDLKLWLVGYSRGAAAADLMAASLDTGHLIQLDSVTLDPENLYVYGFETPNTTRDDRAGAACYRNIFHLMNPADLVGKLPPEAWGYRRYGNTLYFPSVSNAGAEASRIRIYQKISGGHICSFSPEWEADAETLTEMIAERFPDPGAYSLFLIRLLPEAGRIRTKTCKWNRIMELAFREASDPDNGTAFYKRLKMDSEKCPDPGMFLITQIKHAHYPEVCLSWMETVSAGKAELESRSVEEKQKQKS